MQAYGLYTHIQYNRRWSLLLIAGLFCLVYVLVFAGALLGEAMSEDASTSWLLIRAWKDTIASLPVATAATAIWIWIAYKYHQRLIDAVTGGHVVTRAEQPRVYNLLENLCISRGLPMPKLKLIEQPALNAFATGMNETQYSITLTTGLLQALDDAEVEAVLGHELTHIRNGDVQLMVIAVVIAGVIGFVAELLFRGLSRWSFFGMSSSRTTTAKSADSGKGKGGFALAVVIALALVALAWGLSVLIRFALSRRREFLADAGSVELTKNPDKMISALRKIENRGELPGATSGVMEMCIDNPHSGLADLFATHPNIDARVDALVRFAGGTDPGPLALPEASPG